MDADFYNIAVQSVYSYVIILPNTEWAGPLGQINAAPVRASVCTWGLSAFLGSSMRCPATCTFSHLDVVVCCTDIISYYWDWC